MKTTVNHYTIADVCSHYGLSESTIRRKVHDAREGIGNFPLPLFGRGSRVLWRKEDILGWKGEGNTEVVTFTPSTSQPMPPVASQSQATVHRRLMSEHGVNINESNN